MNKISGFVAATALLAALSAVSCAKDKPATSETSAVTTSKDGAVYQVDTANSRVEWKGFKIVKSENASHFGTIKFQSGEITMHEGKLESGKFTADMTSMTSTDLKDDSEQNAKLIGHLKSPDFFDTEKFPTATFEITSVKAKPEGDYNTEISGNLNIKGISKPITLNANVSESEGIVTIATEPKDIDREDFGVKFQMPVANGLIKNEMNLQILIKASAAK